MTREALETYQKKNKLKVTGKTNYETIMHIFGKVSETSIDDDPK